MKQKAWTEVKAFLTTAPADWAILHEAFDRAGISGTVQTDRPPTISGYMYEPSDEQLNQLKSELADLGAINISITEVPETNWAESWKQFFKPRRIGQRFVIRPTWEPYVIRGDDVQIVLDPGQAFGTGDHPTTRMCLELLEKQDLEGKLVADIGCGSGILGIAACLLRAKNVIGVDTEVASVESTRQNMEVNHVEFTVFQGKGFDPVPSNQQFDLVLSNIISAAIINLAPDASGRVAPGGKWIISGIIKQNWPDVRQTVERAGFSLVETLEEDDWIAAIFRR